MSMEEKGTPLSFFLIVQVTADRGRLTSSRAVWRGTGWPPGGSWTGGLWPVPQGRVVSGWSFQRNMASGKASEANSSPTDQDYRGSDPALPCQCQTSPLLTWPGLSVHQRQVSLEVHVGQEVHVGVSRTEFLFQAKCVSQWAPGFVPFPAASLFIPWALHIESEPGSC